MRVECVNPLELTPGDIVAWRRLLAAQPQLSSPYLTPDWTQMVARHRSDVRVAVWRDGARPIGFLPVQRPSSFAAVPVGGPVCDYQALIGPSDTQFDLSAAADALGVGRIDFTAGLHDSALAPHLLTSDFGHVANFADGWSAYCDDRKQAGTKIIPRSQKNFRRLTRDYPGVVDIDAFSTDPLAFDMLVSWKREQMRRTRVTDLYEHPWINNLIRDTFATPATSTFGGALFVLRVDRKPIAAIHFLQARACLHAWQIAYDQKFSDYTPGIVLFVEAIRIAADAGFTQMDLGPGDYRFKESLSNARRDCGAGFVGRFGLSSAVKAAQFQVRALVETLPVGRARQWPAKAMRRLDIAAGLQGSAGRGKAA